MENYINLSDHQIISLCNELANLTYKLKQDEHVECIYFAPYKNFGKLKGNVINITIVMSSNILIDFDKKYQNIISRKEQMSRYGVKISFDTAEDIEYTTFPIKPSEHEKDNDIFNSFILFDRTGKYTKIKSATQKIGADRHSELYYYDNRAEFYPPIAEDLEFAMEKHK